MPAPSQRDALGKLPPWMPAGPTVGRVLPAIERLAARGATSLPELHAKQAAVKYAFEKRGTSKFVRKLVRTADLSDALAVSAELNALSDAELRDEGYELVIDAGDGRRVLGTARLYTKIRSGRFPSVGSLVRRLARCVQDDLWRAHDHAEQAAG